MANFAPRTFNGPESADGRHFGLAACQSLAMIACMIETSGQIAKLADHLLMKHATAGQQAVSGGDMMARLDQTVRVVNSPVLLLSLSKVVSPDAAHTAGNTAQVLPEETCCPACSTQKSLANKLPTLSSSFVLDGLVTLCQPM